MLCAVLRRTASLYIGSLVPETPQHCFLWLLLLILIPTRMSNYFHCRLWDEIIYPFPNFSGWTGIWEWISNFFPHFTVHVITYPCRGPSCREATHLYSSVLSVIAQLSKVIFLSLCDRDIWMKTRPRIKPRTRRTLQANVVCCSILRRGINRNRKIKLNVMTWCWLDPHFHFLIFFFFFSVNYFQWQAWT